MKRFFKLGMKAVLVSLILTLLLAGAAFAVDNPDSPGPAPNSGDCDPDGSGFVEPNGPNGEMGSDYGPAGPAPNSGDGDPDGSGFDEPNGPNNEPTP